MRPAFTKQVQFKTDNQTELARQLSALEDSTVRALNDIGDAALVATTDRFGNGKFVFGGVWFLTGKGSPAWGDAPVGSLYLARDTGTLYVRSS